MLLPEEEDDGEGEAEAEAEGADSVRAVLQQGICQWHPGKLRLLVGTALRTGLATAEGFTLAGGRTAATARNDDWDDWAVWKSRYALKHANPKTWDDFVAAMRSTMPDTALPKKSRGDTAPKVPPGGGLSQNTDEDVEWWKSVDESGFKALFRSIMALMPPGVGRVGPAFGWKQMVEILSYNVIAFRFPPEDACRPDSVSSDEVALPGASLLRPGAAVRPFESLRPLYEARIAALRGHMEALRDKDVPDVVLAEVVTIVNTMTLNPRAFLTRYLTAMLMGPAGSGKTTSARELGLVYLYSGVLLGAVFTASGKDLATPFRAVSKPDLVAEFEGQTGHRTRALLASGIEAVTLVDEAYSLASVDLKPGMTVEDLDDPVKRQGVKWDTYGSEAITELVAFLSENKGAVCVIVAGYEEDMRRRFLNANEGLERRFQLKITLSTKSVEELVRIAQFNVQRSLGRELQWEKRGDKLMHTIVRRAMNVIDGSRQINLFKNLAGDAEIYGQFIAGVISATRVIDAKKAFVVDSSLVAAGFVKYATQFKGLPQSVADRVAGITRPSS